MDNIHYEFGIKNAGPFLFAFTCWLKSKFKEHDVKKAFFFSRDGYMMKKAWETIFPDDNETEVHYLYVSRKSLRQTLLWQSENYNDSLKYLSEQRFTSYKKVLMYYGFDERKINQILEKYNLKETEQFEFHKAFQDNALRSIYYEYLEEIKGKSKQQYEYFQKYLFGEGFDNEQCAIIDIGWHGGMQYFLEEFFRISNVNIGFSAYYIGISPKYNLKNLCYGFLYDDFTNPYRKKVLSFLGVLEKTLQSIEGSTQSYTYNNDKGIVPVLDEYEYDSNLINSINEIHKGIFDYLKKQNYDRFYDVEKLCKALFEFGTTPTLKDIEVFRGFYLKDGNTDYFLAEKPFYKYTLNEIKFALGNSPWKIGFMKSLFKIPFPYFTVYKVLKR